MRTLSIVVFVLAFALFSNSTVAQIEVPPVDSFQLEIDGINNWYDGTGVNYTFDMTGIRRTFGDPVTTPDSFYLVPGEDILDNSMLSGVLSGIGQMTANVAYNVDDTTYFSYPFGTDVRIFTKCSHYICTRKPITSVTLDGDTFSNKSLYRIHEVTVTTTPMIDSPWRSVVDYYAFTDTGMHISSCLSYYHSIAIGFVERKYLQNVRSIPMLRSTKAGPDLAVMLSPVPANNMASVELVSTIGADNIVISLLSLDRKSVKEIKVAKIVPLGRTLYQIDVSSLQSGVYILHVSANGGSTYRKLTIIH